MLRTSRNAIVRGFFLEIDRGQKRGHARGFMQNTAIPASSCATVPLSSAQGLLNWPTLLRIHVLLSVRFWSGKRCILSQTTQCRLRGEHLHRYNSEILGASFP